MIDARKNKPIRLLLYMDILGSRDSFDKDSDESLVIDELIDTFSKNNKEYIEEDFPVTPRKCYLIKSSFLPTMDNIDNLLIDPWTAAYIRFEKKLFYGLKSAKQCSEITISSEKITKIDNTFELAKFETDHPQILSD